MGRRAVKAARVGGIVIGAPAPVVVQSMTTTPTLDTAASVAQAEALARTGASMVRLTAQGVSHAANLANIHRALRERGIDVPLVADIHFNPAAAFEAAAHVEKVRINPGNFFDPGRTFRKMVFTDEEYAAELEKIRAKFVPFLDLCRSHGTAIRIGVNHGSLSDRIMSRFGDGAEGMVESAMEYLRICRDEAFDDVVISIKASDVPVMTDTVRLLVERMEAEDMAYPLHLGVTEAGNAAEGRIKSAVGIGSLLVDGIGDTIRVSLSEDPTHEVPVAHAIIDHAEAAMAAGEVRRSRTSGRRATKAAGNIGGLNTPAILTVQEADALREGPEVAVIDVAGPQVIAQARKAIDALPAGKPAIVVATYMDTDADTVALKAAIDMGTLLLDGYQDGFAIVAPALESGQINRIAQMIIQAAGLARYRAEIVACPGCGRTLFDLPEALERVKDACIHLKHLKIAVMGCIVNGPGEMAGADYGYVGAAAGNVSIYRGIEPVVKNIPQAQALHALIDLIKSDGKWIEP